MNYIMNRISNDKKKPFTIWLTGLPCSGKTTISKNLKNQIETKSRKVVLLDGDDFRKRFLPKLGFSKKDRDANIVMATSIAKFLNENGINVICAFVSPYRNTRNNARKNIKNFIEVYVKAFPEVCSKRDVKGFWKLAKKGKIENFTGYDGPYEIPNKPEVVTDTEQDSIMQSCEKIIKYLQNKKYL